MKKFLTLLILGGALSTYAQTIDDIEAFNIRDLNGSARFTAMGGAFTSLGNDISALHINPASAAIYRKSTLGFNLGFNTSTGNQSQFFGGASNSSNFNVNLENIGYLGTFLEGPYKQEKRYGFGISNHKIANFDRSYAITGTNFLGAFGQGSLADYWLSNTDASGNLLGAFGLAENELLGYGLLEEYAASRAYILVPTNDTITDVAFGTSSPGSSNIRYNRIESGSHNEFALTFGGEASNRLSYGVSLGFPYLSYRIEDQIREFNLPTDTTPFDATSYELNRTNEISATGFNIKLGLIYKMSQWWRIGASYQSPSWYSVDQFYELDVQSSFSDGFQGGSDVISTGLYSYGIRTPAIYRIGTSLIAGKRGLISVDYEYSDPTRGRTYETNNISSISQDDLADGNSSINSLMTSRNTLRIGAELKMGLFFLRGGYSNQSSIYQDGDNYRTKQTNLSGGIGFQTKKFSIDISYVNSEYGRLDYVHPFAGDNLVSTTNTSNNLIIGTSIRF